MKKTLFFTAFLIIIGSAAVSMAFDRGIGCRGGSGWGMNSSMLSSLNLTAEQSEKIRVLRESFMKDIGPIRSQMFNKRAELRLLWIQAKPDTQKIKETQMAARDLIGKVQEKTTDFRLAFRNILTPEQVSRLLSQGLLRGEGKWSGKGGGRGYGRGSGRGSGSCWQN